VFPMPDRPFCRAAITPYSLTLNPWRPSLIRGGPGIACLHPLQRRRLVLADLTKLDEQELQVTFVPRTAGCDWARERLLDWARTVGYQRVWLDNAVVDVTDGLACTGRAIVRCPTCGLRWEDEGPDFWGVVRQSGWFPASCPACGGSLPEWSQATQRPIRAAASKGRPRPVR
jgi:hypothetical protein